MDGPPFGPILWVPYGPRGKYTAEQVSAGPLLLVKPLAVRLKLATGNRQRAGTVWAFGFGSPMGERLTYRGYALEISKHPVGWHLGISPIQPGLPILANHTFTLPYPRKDDALFAARKRIDLLLSL